MPLGFPVGIQTCLHVSEALFTMMDLLIEKFMFVLYKNIEVFISGYIQKRNITKFC